jgi:hypothetical protein
VRGPQDQRHDRSAEAGRVHDPPGRLPHRGDVRGPQRPGVDLVAKPDVPGEHPFGDTERAQFPGRCGGRGQREQVAEQPPAVGQVVVGALLHPGRLPVGHGRGDGEQRDQDQGRPDQREQYRRADERDPRSDHPQGLGGGAREGPAAFSQRVDLAEVVGPLEVLEERCVAGQFADPQAEAQVAQVGHLRVEGRAYQLQRPAGREGDGGDDQADHDHAGPVPVGSVHDGAKA